MSGLNKVMLIGRLGKDPEIRYTQSGTPVANFSVATSETYKDGNGEKQERTEWHNIVIWNKLAEVAQKYLHKGDQVYLEGKIQTRKWQDRDGAEKRTTEVIVHSMTMLGSKRREEGNPAYSDHEPESFGGVEDQDIPF